jgi:Family of unknown function (DUF5829)
LPATPGIQNNKFPNFGNARCTSCLIDILFKIIIVCLEEKYLVCFYFLLRGAALSQSRKPELYLSHIAIVVDSLSYVKLSESNFITQKLGNLSAASTSTEQNSWSGKYLHGKNGYFEFFSTKSYKGALLGDCGVGFMTQKANDILALEINWKENAKYLKASLLGFGLKEKENTLFNNQIAISWFCGYNNISVL